MNFKDKIIAYENKNYMDRLLPIETYQEAVDQMEKEEERQRHLMAITCPSCGKRTANISSGLVNRCWICNAPLELEEKEEEEVLLHQCPKSDKCVMECHHQHPHVKDKYCQEDEKCPMCVQELAADITFFPEDFEIE